MSKNYNNEIAYKSGYEDGYRDCMLNYAGTAKWIISSDGYYPYCSNCKKEPKNRCISEFCPNCGRWMKEE